MARLGRFTAARCKRRPEYRRGRGASPHDRGRPAGAARDGHGRERLRGLPAAVWPTAAIGSVSAPHGFAPPAPPLEVFSNTQRHLLDTGTGAVAVDDDGTVVGF